MAFNKRKILRNAQKYTDNRQWDKAIAEYEKLTQEDFGDTSLQNVLGDLYLNKGDVPRAIEMFNDAAEYYEERGFNLKAVAIYKKVLRLDPNQSEYYRKLAALYIEQNLIQEAIEQLEILAAYYEKQDYLEKALQTYNQISDLDPANINMRVKIGELYERRGLNEQAAEEYNRAGEAFTKQGELGSAFTYFRKAFSLNDKNSNSLKGIVGIYLNTEQIAKALETMKAILERSPDDIQTLFILGRTYLQEGDQESALPVFERIITIQPNIEGVHEIVGRLYMQRGEHEKARLILERIVDRHIENEAYQEALKILQQLQTANSKDLNIRKKIAKVFLKLDMEERALQEYQTIGELYIESGKPKLAFKLYEKLYLMHPDNPQFRKQYFELARSLGVQPVFIEHGAKEEREESTGVEVDVGSLEVSVGKEFEAQKSSTVEKRPRAYGTQLTREQREKIQEFHSEAEVFVKYGLTDNAIHRLREVLDLDPFDIDAIIKLRDLFKTTKRTTDYLQYALQVAEYFEQHDSKSNALEAYNEILQVNPDNQRALNGINRLTGKEPPLQTKAVEVVEELPAPKEKDEPLRLIGAVPPAPKTDELKEETASVEAEFGIESELPRVEEYKARELSRGASTDVDVNEVIGEFRRGINKRISPKDFETHYNLGIAYREMGLLDEAISEFRIVLNMPEMVIEGCANLGSCFMEKQDYDKAIRILEYGMKRASSDPEKHLSLKFELARAYEEKGSLRSALKLLQEIYDEKPGFRNVAGEINRLKGSL